MAEYTPLSRADLEGLAAEFGLTLTSFAPMPGGNANSSYRLGTAEAEVVLTVCDDKDWAEAEALAELLEHLQEQAFPSTPILRTLDGRRLARFDDKPVLLKRFVPGHTPDEADDEQLEQMGEAMAKLHRIAPTRSLPGRHAYGVHRFDDVLGRGPDPDYERWLESRIEPMAQLAARPLPTGLIHGDLFADNVAFDGARLAAVLDFEEACVGHFAFDVAMAVVGSRGGAAPAAAQVGAVLRGYQRVRVMQADEVASLWEQVAYAAAATSTWRYRKFGLEQPGTRPPSAWWSMVDIATFAETNPRLIA